jgi:hypothetical protein
MVGIRIRTVRIGCRLVRRGAFTATTKEKTTM